MRRKIGRKKHPICKEPIKKALIRLIIRLLLFGDLLLSF